MGYGLRQALLLSVGGFGGLAIIVALARRSMLTLRYTLSWVAICVLALVASLSTSLIQPVADAFGMSPTGVLFSIATVVLLAITLQLSVTLSRQTERLRDLAEAHALLRDRVERSFEEPAVRR